MNWLKLDRKGLINAFLGRINSFDDSSLVNLTYSSGTKTDEYGYWVQFTSSDFSNSQITALFNSGWEHPFYMRFIGVSDFRFTSSPEWNGIYSKGILSSIDHNGKAKMIWAAEVENAEEIKKNPEAPYIICDSVLWACEYYENDDLFPCPICGSKTLSEESGSFDICHICGWEEDGLQPEYPDMLGPNEGWTFREAKKSWDAGKTLFSRFPNPNATD